jgi:hypothetical protein
MSQHVHTNRNNHPDIIDRDGDRWSWTDSDTEGKAGYRLAKRRNPSLSHLVSDDAQYTNPEDIRSSFGPITEVPVTNAVTFKLPEIPADVEKLKVVGSDKVFVRQGEYWEEVSDNSWGGGSYTLAEILGDYPEGVEAVVKTPADKAADYFRDRDMTSTQPIIDRLSFSTIARNHAAEIIVAYLDNHSAE